MAKKPKIDAKTLAENYGWAYAFLQSIPELRRLMRKAVAEQWTAPRFQAALRDTHWWKTHSDTFKQNQALRATDPATYKQRLNATKATIRDMAGQVGAFLGASQLDRIAKNAFNFGWNEAQLRDVLAQSVDNYFTQHHQYGGEAADVAEQVRGLALRNGVKFSDATLATWLQRVVAGDETTEGLESRIREMAATAFPAFADQIRGGINMADIASPYVESMSRLLELNPVDVDLFDPSIRKALQPTNIDNSQQASATPLWQFERQVRQDPRWLKTNNAREALAGVGRQVLKDFGFVGV